jgi:hypothetical protein
LFDRFDQLGDTLESAEGQYLYESRIRPQARTRSRVAEVLTSHLDQATC